MAYYPRRYFPAIDYSTGNLPAQAGFPPDGADYPIADPPLYAAYGTGYPPVQPVSNLPLQPAIYGPAQPVMPPPVQPVISPPVQPVIYAPAQPVISPPVQPVIYAPAQPLSNLAVQPVSNPTVQPLSTALQSSQRNGADLIALTTTKTAPYVLNKKYKYFGIILCLLSIASLAVEIANVAYTYFTLCGTNTASTASPYILTWIAPGIWGSLVVFITGFLAIRYVGTSDKNKIFTFILFCALTAFAFAPVIIAISIAEIILYNNVCAGQNGYSLNNIPTSAKFILPVVETILAGIELYLTLNIVISFCCCMKPSFQKWNTSETKISPVTVTTPAPTNNTSPPAPPVTILPLQPVYITEPTPPPPPLPPPPPPVYLRPYVRPSFRPVLRPALSTGFGSSSPYYFPASAAAPSAYPFYGSNPTMASLMTQAPNPAYQLYG